MLLLDKPTIVGYIYSMKTIIDLYGDKVEVDLDDRNYKIILNIRRDLLEQLPQKPSELNAFINKAVERAILGPEWLRKAQSAKTPAKASASRENGKKGGRPKKNQNQESKNC